MTAAHDQFTLHHGDALDVLRSMPAASVDAIVTDPPAGIGFMNADWDKDKGGRDAWIAWLAEVFAEARRVVKPGAHALVWALPRTSHWTATGLEDAGWELRDRVAHFFGCLSDDTEVLVDGKWCHFSQATKGRLALAFDVEKGSYAWLPIENLYVYQEDNLAFRLRSDATDQIVSRHHRCVVARDGEYVFRIAEDVAREREARVPVLEDLPGLLAALPLPQSLAGGAKQDVREGVRGTADLGGEAREVPHAAGCLHSLRGDVSPERQCADVGREVLLDEVQRRSAVQRSFRGRSLDHDRLAGSRGMDGVLASLVPHEDERRAESCLEGRRDDFQEARQLRWGPVRPVSGGASLDGEEGRLRDGASDRRGASDGSCASASGGGASREPRSEGQPDREPRALRDEPRSQAVRGARFTRSDLVRVEPIHYRGIIWCIQIATGAFVARRNGKVFVTGNTGFPKSKNLDGEHEGWGTALKPAVEDWHLARAPFAGTVAANVAEHGTGALHIDACRIGVSKGVPASFSKHDLGLVNDDGWVPTREGGSGSDPNIGRWPAHLVISHNPDCFPLGTAKVKAAPAWNDNRPASSFTGAATSAVHHADDDGTETVERWECSAGCAVGMLDEQSGERTSGKMRPTATNAPRAVFGQNAAGGYTTMETYGDSGGASRFFFCASWSEREKCDLAITANETSSPASGRVDSALGGAATSGHLAGKRCDDSRAPSTSATPKPSRPSADDGTPQTRRTGRKSSRASAHGSTSSSDHALCVETRGPTVTTTTTASRSTSASSAASATSPITGTSLGRGDRDFARFLFCAKPSTAEREMGLDGFIPATTDDGRETTSDTAYQRGATMRRNIHPTVKSVALMRWLLRLITPPGGLVLDLFTGSGTTGIAAMCEGARFVGVEQSAEFARIARARIAFAAANPRAFDPEAVKGPKPDARQLLLCGGT